MSHVVGFDALTYDAYTMCVSWANANVSAQVAIVSFGTRFSAFFSFKKKKNAVLLLNK